uniref:Uncharacterized protein n=1 Tax=Mycobacterium kansasii TaxID=1768 RepID=A0A653F6T6_MYCKA|nr:hypothetical protein BIN_B_05165 [Mycobacterium kansasii]
MPLSHNRTVPSAMVSPAETMRRPSGLKPALSTGPVWPVSGAPIGAPVAASHNRSVLSSLPETMRRPSGLNATLSTGAVWPVSGAPTGLPVAASHNRSVLSAPPEAMRRPSGLNATLKTASGVGMILMVDCRSTTAVSSALMSVLGAMAGAARICWIARTSPPARTPARMACPCELNFKAIASRFRVSARCLASLA